MAAALWATPLLAQVADPSALQHARDRKAAGRLTDAAGELERLAAQAPGDARVQFILAWVYVDLGQREQAVAAFEKVIELAPSTDNAAEARKALARLRPADSSPAVPSGRAEPQPTATESDGDWGPKETQAAWIVFGGAGLIFFAALAWGAIGGALSRHKHGRPRPPAPLAVPFAGAAAALPLGTGAGPAPRPRNQQNDGLRTFYTRVLNLSESRLVECEGCRILLLADTGGLLGMVGTLSAVQNNPQAVGMFVLTMKALLGDANVTVADNVGAFGLTFLDQFVADPCPSCGKRLCPVCRKGDTARDGCLLCETAATPAPAEPPPAVAPPPFAADQPTVPGPGVALAPVAAGEPTAASFKPGLCDICNAEVGTADGDQVSASTMRAMVERGFNPSDFDEQIRGMNAMLGISLEEWYEDWKVRVVGGDVTDWRLCERCVENTRPFR